MLNYRLMEKKTLFRIWNGDRSVRKAVVAENVAELKRKGMKKRTRTNTIHVQQACLLRCSKSDHSSLAAEVSFLSLAYT